MSFNTAIPSYAKQGLTFEYITESYVVSPPAAYIIASDGTTFCLGLRMHPFETDKLKGLYQFNILVNGSDSGIFASKIEKKGNRVRILTRDQGWLYWNGNSFV